MTSLCHDLCLSRLRVLRANQQHRAPRGGWMRESEQHARNAQRERERAKDGGGLERGRSRRAMKLHNSPPPLAIPSQRRVSAHLPSCCLAGKRERERWERSYVLFYILLSKTTPYPPRTASIPSIIFFPLKSPPHFFATTHTQLHTHTLSLVFFPSLLLYLYHCSFSRHINNNITRR